MIVIAGDVQSRPLDVFEGAGNNSIDMTEGGNSTLTLDYRCLAPDSMA